MSDLPELRASTEELGLRVEYVPPNQPQALAHGIRGLLADEVRMTALATHNLEVMRKYTPMAIRDLYLAVFRSAMTLHRRQRITCQS